jgi:4,5-dihydroxyphthalate decarboxylase
MARVPLVFGGADYWDRTLALIDGRVKPEGIELNWVMKYPGEFFGQMIRGEFEAGEMSTAFMVMLVDQGIDTLVGLPIFTSRAFRHANILVHADAGINKPEDMKGKRVGVPDYPMTSAVWARGYLLHDYGVAAGDMEWFQGGLESAGWIERVPTTIAPHIKVTTVQDKSLLEMFLNREVDALTGPALPRSLAGNPKVRMLFENPAEAEKDFYKRTGIFPITHLVTMRRDVYQRHPWMIRSMMDAFEQSKEIGWRSFNGNQAHNMPWVHHYLHEIQDVFGGNPYKDGFDANRTVLDALCSYMHEQGLTKRRVAPEEVFAPESLFAGH